MKLERSIRGRTAVLEIEGALTAEGAREAADAAERSHAGIIEAVFFDMTGCELSGPDAAAPLLAAFRRLLERGCKVMVNAPPPALAEGFRAAGLSQVGLGLRLIEKP